ncbi:MAG: nucleotidyltransferase domain-containing protein [Thermodesulfobacteriota bacterium]
MPSRTALDIPRAMWSQYHPFRSEADDSMPAALAAEARGVARKVAEELKQRFGAKRVVIFGSLARGDLGIRSDIDLAAWGIPPVDYFRAVGYVTGFRSAWKIDLVDAEDCSTSLREVIEREGVEA